MKQKTAQPEVETAEVAIVPQNGALQHSTATHVNATLDLLSAAIARGKDFPIDIIERLASLHKEQQAMAARQEYYSAFARFQNMVPDLTKDKIVSFSTSKGDTRYNFAGLGTISRKIKEPLMKCGLSYRYEITTTPQEIKVRCILSHEGGHSESCEMSAPPDSTGNKNVVQQNSSTVTYLQRYTLIAVAGLTTADVDDDAVTSTAGKKPVEFKPTMSLSQLQDAVEREVPDKNVWALCYNILGYMSDWKPESSKALLDTISKKHFDGKPPESLGKAALPVQKFYLEKLIVAFGDWLAIQEKPPQKPNQDAAHDTEFEKRTNLEEFVKQINERGLGEKLMAELERVTKLKNFKQIPAKHLDAMLAFCKKLLEGE